MKKKTLNPILLGIVSLVIFSCSNPQANSKQGYEVATFDACLYDCGTREKACWDEYDKSKRQALADEQVALSRCSHLTPQNQLECKGQAISEYQTKREQYELQLRACLGELSNCRQACANHLTKLPDTK